MAVGIPSLAKKISNRPNVLIPFFIIGFSILGGTIGLSEETIIFIPMAVLLARNLGFDAIVGFSIVFLGAAVGFNSGFMNPFTVGVAQSIAGLETFSGMWLRLLIWISFIISTIWYILKYGKKVKENPELSLVRDLEIKEKENEFNLDNIQEMNSVHKIIGVLFLISLGIIIFGVIELDFYINEISAVFLLLAVIAGFVNKTSPNQMAELFLEGAAEIITGALVVGVARGILVVLNDGQILYTIVHGVGELIKDLPSIFSANVMFVFQLFFNFFIPSGSGQAATTMPIIVPIADLAEITRQTAVLAFHLGDGISNSIIPTDGTLLAALLIAGIDYEDWFKFIWPLILIWSVISMAFISLAVVINYI